MGIIKKNIFGYTYFLNIVFLSIIPNLYIFSSENTIPDINTSTNERENYKIKEYTQDKNSHRNSKNLYKPIFNSFDVILDYGGPLWDLGKRLLTKDKILSIKGGFGLNTRYGFYTQVITGYTNINSLGIPKYDALPKYRTFGPHLRVGPGYALEYLRGGYIIFLIRYGISLYKSEVDKIKNNKLLYAHYIDIVLDNKARIVSYLNFFLGAQIGVQFLIHHDELNGNLNNYLIPGYGWCKNRVAICGGLYIAYCFQFTKDYKSVK